MSLIIIIIYHQQILRFWRLEIKEKNPVAILRYESKLGDIRFIFRARVSCVATLRSEKNNFVYLNFSQASKWLLEYDAFSSIGFVMSRDVFPMTRSPGYFCTCYFRIKLTLFITGKATWNKQCQQKKKRRGKCGFLPSLSQLQFWNNLY